MTSINIGPLAFPIAPLIVLAAWALASSLARWIAPQPLKAASSSTVSNATLIGLLAARLAHVATHAGAYADAPLSIVDFRDGGWHATAGVLAGVAWLAWRAWRLPLAVRDVEHRPLWRRALMAGTTLGLVAWMGAVALNAPSAGLPMPGVLMTRLDNNQPTTIAQLAAGRPMVVNLWATWCAPCRAEMPAFAQAQQAMPDVMFVFANQGEAAPLVARYLSTMAIPQHTVVLDPAWALGAAVGSRSLPTTLFVNARGVIVKTHVGVLNRAALQVQVDALRAAR